MQSLMARQIRQVQCQIQSLPFGLGEKLISLYLSVYGYRRKSALEKNEAMRIARGLQEGLFKKFVVVYDELASPPTYGDFLCTVMLARYFSATGLFVKFVIISGEFRKDWVNLNAEEKERRTSDYVDLARALLPPQSAEIEVSSWAKFDREVLGPEKADQCVIFERCVTHRNPIYNYAFNTINLLCVNITRSHLMKFLLSQEELLCHIGRVKPAQRYITWHCRLSQKVTSQERNTTEEEFLYICQILKGLFPSFDLMIVSDSFGCQYFKKLAREHNISCLFSKDYSAKFLGDAALVLGSEYHFALRGGGIDMFALFSQISYEIHMTFMNERAWSRSKANTWSSRNQLYKDIKWSLATFPPTGKIKQNLLNKVD